MEGIPAAFEMMKDRIRSTHVHDNNGKDDHHLFPTLSPAGTVNWADTMALLRSREHQYPLLLELKANPDFPQPLEAIQRIFENLEKV
jgi:sugar phosphate isomerase/epimerase